MECIDDALARRHAKCIVIDFQDKTEGGDRKKVVDKIKKYFDVFIILKSDMLSHKNQIEEYYFYGVHGLFVQTGTGAYSKDQIQVLTAAAELFSRGWVFAGVADNDTAIDELLAHKIIPVPTAENKRLIELIKSNPLLNKISPNLKCVPLLDREEPDYSLADRIKMKMLLETMNLRQKLMVKNIDESFGSSGL